MNAAISIVTRGLKTFASDVVDGFFEITHNGFALVGLAIVIRRPDTGGAAGPAAKRRGATHGLAAIAPAGAGGH